MDEVKDLPPAAAMAVESFLASAVVLPVNSSEAGGLSIVGPDKLELLQRAAKVAMTAIGKPDRAAEVVTAIQRLSLRDDLWYSALPDGSMVILVQERIFNALTVREIAEQVHKAEIQAAASRGQDVPDELLDYYRTKRPPKLEPQAQA